MYLSTISIHGVIFRCKGSDYFFTASRKKNFFSKQLAHITGDVQVLGITSTPLQ
jgi:hypothetical protein